MMLKCCWNVFWTDHLQMMIEMMPLFWKLTRTWKGTRKDVDETHQYPSDLKLRIPSGNFMVNPRPVYSSVWNKCSLWNKCCSSFKNFQKWMSVHTPILIPDSRVVLYKWDAGDKYKTLIFCTDVSHLVFLCFSGKNFIPLIIFIKNLI